MSEDGGRVLPVVPAGLQPPAVSVGDPDAALRMLEEWMADESGYDEETWPELKAALDQNRPPGAR